MSGQARTPTDQIDEFLRQLTDLSAQTGVMIARDLRGQPVLVFMNQEDYQDAYALDQADCLIRGDPNLTRAPRQLSIGDIVQVKSGGPSMTIHSIFPSGNIAVTWYENGQVRTEYIPKDALMEVDDYA